MKKYIYLIMAHMLFATACEVLNPEEVEKLQYVGVSLTSVANDPDEVGKVILTGSITGFSDEDNFKSISQHGFLWSTSTNLPDFENFEGIRYLGLFSENSPFENPVEGISSKKTYYFRAFAQSGDQTFLSDEILSFNISLSGINTVGYTYDGKRDLNFIGRIEDIQKRNVTIVEHGFCWNDATSGKLPDLSDEVSFLGNNEFPADYSFEATNILEGKDPKLAYRAFAIYSANATLDTIFGETRTFEEPLYDVWELAEYRFPVPIKDLLVFQVAQDRYIVGGGSTVNPALGTFYPQPQYEFWEVTAAGDQLNFSVLPDLQLDSTLTTFGKAHFVIQDTMYMFGGVSPTTPVPSGNFLKATMNNAGWENVTSTNLPFRRGFSMGFALNNKGYVFGGSTFIFAGGQRVEFLNDLWSYDPVTGKWEEIVPQDGQPWPEVRDNANVFVSNGLAYIAFGYSPGAESYNKLSDIWAFDPTNNSWTQIQEPFIENCEITVCARNAATSAVLDNGTVYLGLGDKDVAFLNDFWALDLSTNVIERKPDLPNTIYRGVSAVVFENRVFAIGGQPYNASQPFINIYTAKPF